MDARHGGTVRTEEVGLEIRADALCKLLCGVFANALIAVAHKNVDDAAERRVKELAPLEELTGVHGVIVVRHDLLHHGQLRLAGLKHHEAATAFAPCAPRHLAEHLKRTLKGAEVGHIETLVGIEDAHHVDPLEIESFRDHLRTDQDVRFAPPESLEDTFITGTAARGVEVHARRAGFGEKGAHGGFYLLRAITQVAQFGATAVGTLLGQRIGRSAVVANKASLLLMVGERYVAMLAMRRPATGVAFQHGTIAAAVLKEDDLFVMSQRFANLFGQARRERTFHEFLTA